MNKRGIKTIIVSVIAGVLFILLMCNWLSVPGLDLFTDDSNYTMWEIGGLLNNIGNAANSFDSYFGSGDSSMGAGLVLLAIFIYMALIAAIGSVVWTVISAIQHYKKNVKITNIGFIVPSVLSVLMILFVIIANAVISEQTDGWISSIVKLTATPFILLVLAMGGVLVNLLVRDAQLSAIGEKAMQMGGRGTERRQNQVSAANQRTPMPQQRASAARSHAAPMSLINLDVDNYCPDSPLRIFKASLCCDVPVGVQISIADYKDVKLSAMRADIELITAFRDSVWVRMVPFIELVRTQSEQLVYVSEFAPIDFPTERCREIRAIRIYPRLTVENDTVNEQQGEYIDAGLSTAQLLDLRAEYGCDAMREKKDNGETWECVCGYTNSWDTASCKLCGRKKTQPVASVHTPESETAIKPAVRCRVCGAEMEDGAVFCANCGAKIEPVFKAKPATRCRVCGTMLEDGAMFCANCGAKNEPAFSSEPISVIKPVTRCRVCGTVLEADAMFCANCGAKR